MAAVKQIDEGRRGRSRLGLVDNGYELLPFPLKASRDVLSQILSRRRFGLRSVCAGLGLALLWQMYKRLVRLPIVLTTWKGTLFLLEPNSVTSSRFVYERRPDESFIDTLAAFADGPEGDALFVDVGANVGLYTVLLCRTFRHGILFEPNPVAAAMARRNLALNGVDDRFRLIDAAVGRAAGSVTIPVVAVPDPALRVQCGASPGAGGLTVAMVALDSAVPSGAVVMKIDAEGFDADVIEGFAGAFADGRVRVCLFECHDDAVLARVLAAVEPRGYAVMDGARRIRRIDEPRGRDLFVVRGDLMSRHVQAVGG